MDDTAHFSVTLDAIEGLGTRLQLRTHDPLQDLVSRLLHERRCWEPFETALWLASQQSGCVAVDVGANLGYFSLLCALHPATPERIIAFEPANDNYRLLCANLDAHGASGRVEAIAVALGETPESGVLYRSDDNLGDHQIYAGDGERSTELIQIRNGHACLAALGVTTIDLLKVDTQGSEYAVIAGLMPILLKSRPSIRILIELTPWSLRCAGSSGAALLELLAQLDLPVSIVDHIEHDLIRSSFIALSEWSDNVDASLDDRGFMNILVGHPPAGF